jgi:hypothetical protein
MERGLLMGAIHSLPAGPVIMGLPIASVTARHLDNGWYLLRYRLASEWVEVYSLSRVDLDALRSVLVDVFKCLADIYTLSSDGSVFILEDYHE